LVCLQSRCQTGREPSASENLHRPPTDPEIRRTLLGRAYENAERVMDLMRLHS